MERRLAAILAADVVGYSRLIREDEAGTLADAGVPIMRQVGMCPHRAAGTPATQTPQRALELGGPVRCAQAGGGGSGGIS